MTWSQSVTGVPGSLLQGEILFVFPDLLLIRRHWAETGASCLDLEPRNGLTSVIIINIRVNQRSGEESRMKTLSIN